MITSLFVDGFPLVGADGSGAGAWKLLDLTGWYDGAQIRRDRQNKAQQPGAWTSKGFPADVPISLSGTASYDDPAVAKRAAESFRVVGGVGESQMILTDAAGTKSMGVEVDGRTVQWANHFLFRWSLLLTAPDPLKYGPPTWGTATLAASTPGAGRVWPRVYPTDYGLAPGVIPGAVPVANAGSAPYWPRLRVAGPVTNPVISLAESGAWIRYGGSLVLGQWLDIDLANRTVLLNGSVSMRQKVTSYGDWLSVSPGGGSIAWVADTADSAALLSVTAYEGAWS